MSSTLTDMVNWLKSWFYTETEIDTLLASKQDTLISGSNIKTVNNESIIGDGNINVDNFDVDNYDVTFTTSFGVGGLDDTITIHTELIEKEQ